MASVLNSDSASIAVDKLLTAGQYKELERNPQIKDYSEILSKVDGSLERFDGFTLSMYNVSQRELEKLGEYFYENLNKEQSDGEEAGAEKGPLTAKRRIIVSCEADERFRYLAPTGEVEVQGTKTEKTFGEDGKWCHLKSSLLYDPPYPGGFSWTDIIKSIRDNMQESIIFSEISPYEIEWTCSIRGYSEKQIKTAIDCLKSKGFEVDLKHPYLVLEKNEDEKNINIKEYLTVLIPKDAQISDDAKFERVRSYKETLSVNNLLVARRDKLKELKNVKIESKSSEELEEHLNKICNDLKYIANQNTMLDIFGHEVSDLNEQDQEILKNKLVELGYNVTLDRPSIRRHFVGILNGWYRNCISRKLLITLPRDL